MAGRSRRITPASRIAWAAFSSRWASPSSSINSSDAPRALAASWHSSQSLLRRAVAGRLAARADDHVRRPPGAGLQGDDTAAAELDVVGMGSRRPAGAPAQVGGST